MAQSIPETVPTAINFPAIPGETNDTNGHVIEVQVTWDVVLDVVPLSFIHDNSRQQYISKGTWLQWYKDAHKKPPAWMEAASYDWVKLRGIEGDTECLAAFVEVEFREQRKVPTVVPGDEDWEAMQQKQEQLIRQRAQQRAVQDARTYAAYRQRQQQKKAGVKPAKELKRPQRLCFHTIFKQQLQQLPRLLCVAKRICASTSRTQLLQGAAQQGAEKAVAQHAANFTYTPSGATGRTNNSKYSLKEVLSTTHPIEHALWPESAPVAAGCTTTGDVAAAASASAGESSHVLLQRTTAGIGAENQAWQRMRVPPARTAAVDDGFTAVAGGSAADESESLSVTDDDEGTASAGGRDVNECDSDNELECEGLSGRIDSMSLMLAAI